MIFFIYGPNSYDSSKKLHQIIEKEKAVKKSVSLSLLEGNELSFQNFKNIVTNRSMFEENKIVILRDTFSRAPFKNEFLKEGKHFLKYDILIIFYEGKEVDKRESLFKFLKENAKSFESGFLTREKLFGWVREEFAKYGKKASPECAEKLVIFSGNDQWRLENEIRKVANYSSGKEISDGKIDILVRPKIENDIFKTIDALASLNKREAFRLLHNHLKSGDSSAYLLSMINFQFRNLLEVKDLMERNLSFSAVLQKSSLHPFVVKKTYWQAKKFSLSQLKKIYRDILRADISIKTGKTDPETALDLLVFKI